MIEAVPTALAIWFLPLSSLSGALRNSLIVYGKSYNRPVEVDATECDHYSEPYINENRNRSSSLPASIHGGTHSEYWSSDRRNCQQRSCLRIFPYWKFLLRCSSIHARAYFSMDSSKDMCKTLVPFVPTDGLLPWRAYKMRGIIRYLTLFSCFPDRQRVAVRVCHTYVNIGYPTYVDLELVLV